MSRPNHYRDDTCGECEHYSFATSLCVKHNFDTCLYAVCDDYRPVTGDIADLGGEKLSWKHV